MISPRDYRIHDLINRFHKPRSCLDSSSTRLWAYSMISSLQPPLIIAFIAGIWAYTAIIRPQPPLTGGQRLEISLYAHLSAREGGWPRKKLLYAQNSKNQRWLEALKSAICPNHYSSRSYGMEHRKFGLSKRIGYIVIFFKLTHPSKEFSGSETGHIREKMDCHIHWMSELRTYALYIMVW